MQRTSQSGGMGAALGGGAAESAFGSDTNNVLTKATVYSIIAFFLVALGLYLIHQMKVSDQMQEVDMSSLITSQNTSPAADMDAQEAEFEVLATEGRSPSASLMTDETLSTENVFESAD